jgi:hypothetical protein
MVNEKQTPTRRPSPQASQMREKQYDEETVELPQKFEFLAYFFQTTDKIAKDGPLPLKTAKTIPALVSEKAQKCDLDTGARRLARRAEQAVRKPANLNDCSMEPNPATPLQAPGTWARENDIKAQTCCRAAVAFTSGLDTA